MILNGSNLYIYKRGYWIYNIFVFKIVFNLVCMVRVVDYIKRKFVDIWIIGKRIVGGLLYRLVYWFVEFYWVCYK